MTEHLSHTSADGATWNLADIYQDVPVWELDITRLEAGSAAASVQRDVALARLRGYPSTAAMFLRSQDVPESVYHAVVDGMHDELRAPVQRFLDLRRRVLGLDRLELHDLAAPLDPEFRPETLAHEFGHAGHDYLADRAQAISNIDDRARLYWAAWPHYYLGTYNFTYPAGIACAFAIVDDIRRRGPGNYLAALASGASLPPLELARLASVDLSTREPMITAGAVFDRLVADLDETILS